MSWANKELEKVDLGDIRRNRRLVKIVEDLAGNPESSIPQACRNAAAIQAAYDFFNNPRVKAEAIAIAHRESTIERAKEHSLVLAVQDTTELDPHFSQNLRSSTAKALLDNSFSVQTPSFHIQQCVNR